jgi:phenylalanyl-tRNA synthetase alpha chain
MKEKFEELLKQLPLEICNLKTFNQVMDLKAKYLGKESFLAGILKEMGKLDVEEKRNLGIIINDFKINVTTIFEKKFLELENEKINEKLLGETIDVTLKGDNVDFGYEHIMMKTKREIENIFIELGYSIEEGPEVETDLYNFEMLNLPKNHPARDMQDTFYFNNSLLLRTHTSPVQVHTMLKKQNDNIKIICPGKAYRRDNDDATHSHQFVQVEGLVISKNVTMANLKGTLLHLFKRLFENDVKIRFRPSYFPFTEPSVEVDLSCFKCHGQGCPLCKKTGWIEMGGAGLVHPNVLEMANIDPNIYSGFAFGMGIDRITQLKYEIDDLRNFYNFDLKFMKQFR